MVNVAPKGPGASFYYSQDALGYPMALAQGWTNSLSKGPGDI